MTGSVKAQTHPHPLANWMAKRPMTLDEAIEHCTQAGGTTSKDHLRNILRGHKRLSWDYANFLSQAITGSRRLALAIYDAQPPRQALVARRVKAA